MSQQKSKPINGFKQFDRWTELVGIYGTPMQAEDEMTRAQLSKLFKTTDNHRVKKLIDKMVEDQSIEYVGIRRSPLTGHNAECWKPTAKSKGHNSADPLLTTGLPERGRHKRAG